MGFINDVITDDDMKNLNPEMFKTVVGDFHVYFDKWTADRKRGAFLMYLKGGRKDEGIPEIYAFIWKGILIPFSAFISGNGDINVGRYLYWDVFNMEIPDELQSEKNEIIIALKEALDAHGRIYNRVNVLGVEISIR